MNLLSFPDWLELKGEVPGVRKTVKKDEKDIKKKDDDVIKVQGVISDKLRETIIKSFCAAKSKSY